MSKINNGQRLYVENGKMTGVKLVAETTKHATKN